MRPPPAGWARQAAGGEAVALDGGRHTATATHSTPERALRQVVACTHAAVPARRDWGGLGGKGSYFFLDNLKAGL